MNKTILTIGIALLMLGFPASAKSDIEAEPAKILLGDEPSTDNAECSLGSGTHPLADGVGTTASLTAVVGASCEFVFTPIAGFAATKVVLSGLASDFDLYVKRGALPTTSIYDCRPFSGGLTPEVCVVANDAQQVFVMVRRFSGSGAFTVTAQGYNPPPACPAGTNSLAPAAPVSYSLANVLNANCMFMLPSNPVADVATFTVSNLDSNFDLYVKIGAAPTTSSYDCRSIASGINNEVCSVAADAGDIFVMVRRSSGSGGFTLSAAETIVPVLENGVPVEISLAAAGASTMFKLVVPEGSTLASFVMAPADDVNAAPTTCMFPELDPLGLSPTCAPDADMYVRRGAIPTTAAYDCRPYPYGSLETCTFETNARGALTAVNDAAAGADAEVPMPVSEVDNFAGPGKYFVLVRSFAGAPHVVLQGATA